MSLVSALASVLYAALPRPVRCPVPRRSEGALQFDAFMHELDEACPWPAAPVGDPSFSVTRRPADAPSLAVQRRARH
jgi:hypothetical protein